MPQIHKNPQRAAILGLAVGDALGVPVEFLNRETLKKDPVKEMLGYGTHNQPKGTWSDDSSLALCLADSLCQGYDLQKIAQSFVDWRFNAKWTPHGEVFDIGGTTRRAIENLKNGVPPELSGENSENSNGNGSLMRILPLLFYVQNLDEKARFETVRAVSSLTHRHIRSVLACYYYLEFARLLCEKPDLETVYRATNAHFQTCLKQLEIPENESAHFGRVLSGEIGSLPEIEILGSGYVVHSLEASLWCLFNSNSFREAVLKAVNLGEDTDTNSAITGGLAGLFYGVADIPLDWINCLARIVDIENLILVFQETTNHFDHVQIQAAVKSLRAL